jgi:hypothetical protein
MVPALRHGDQLLAWMRPPRPPRPGSVVLVDLPAAGLSVKRVVRVDPDGSIWVEGDNPFGSTDSRQTGGVRASALRGRVVARLWPRPGLVRRRRNPSGPSPE